MPNSIVHDDVSESYASSSPDSTTTTEEMRFFPRWIGCQRTATPTISSSSSFQCPSHMNSVRSEWRVEDFEQEVSLYFLAPDLTLDIDTPLRNQSSSATLQTSGTVTPIPRKNNADNNNNRDRRSSFLKFNLGDLFRPPPPPPLLLPIVVSPNSNIRFESDTHLTSAVDISPSSSSSSSPPPPQQQTWLTRQNNNNLISLPSVSSASVSTYASASAFTVASSHPSISTYVSAASASVAPSSVSTSGGRSRSRSSSRRSRIRTPSHFSSSSCSYYYPYSDYMSSSSGLSVHDIAAGIDTTEQQEPVPTSPTTIASISTSTSTTTTTTTTSLSVSSSPPSTKRSNNNNLVRRLRLRGGADESYLKLKPSLNAGISSSGGIFSSPSPNKSSSPSRAKSRNGSKGDDNEEEEDDVYPRPNPNAKLKKRFIFVELDEQGQIIDRRGNNNNKTNRTSSSYRSTDESTLRQRGNGHHHHNDTIGRTTTNNSPLAVVAEQLSSTLSHNPLFQLRFRKQKRLLVKDIPTDDGEYTRSRIIALRQWAESLGAVRRLLRSIPDGTIWIEFKDREVAENVCHLHAHVHIPNVGRVRLDWVEGREAG